MSAGQVNTAEVAFAGCEEVDKLQYMLYIKQLPTKEARLAELALYRNNASEAETILLQVALSQGLQTCVTVFPKFCKDPLLLQGHCVAALSATYTSLLSCSHHITLRIQH